MRRKSSLEVEEMAIATINPATGKIINTFAPLTDPQIDEKIGKAEETFRSYRWSSFPTGENGCFRPPESSKRNKIGSGA